FGSCATNRGGRQNEGEVVGPYEQVRSLPKARDLHLRRTGNLDTSRHPTTGLPPRLQRKRPRCLSGIKLGEYNEKLIGGTLGPAQLRPERRMTRFGHHPELRIRQGVIHLQREIEREKQ